MGLLRFTVRNQRLSGGQITLVSDTIDYFDAEFDFRTEDWSGLSKWAHFSKEDVVYDVNLVDDKITKDMHLNLDTGIWEVKLHGTDSEGTTRVTTEIAYLTVESYGNAENENPLPEIPLSAAEQIDAKSQLAIEKAENAKTISEAAVLIAEEIREKADNGEFNGEKGEPGITPEIQIGAVATIPPEEEAEVTIGGTIEKPILNFAIPQGIEGKQGVGVQSISTSESEEDSGINYVNIYLTDGRIFMWPVRNGSKGDKGEPGLVWRGEWDPQEYYSAIKNGQFSRDVVSYNGSSYVVAVNSTAPVVGVVPEGDTTGKWVLLASKGDTGERGPQGEADLGEYEKRIEEIETELEAINPFKFTSAGANPNVLEIGNSVSSVVVSWALSKDPVSVSVNGEEATAAKSGSHTVNESVTATADPAFKEFAVSAANESGKTVSSKARINFYNGIYYGAGAIPSSTDLSFLTKVLSGSRGRTFTATANEGEYLWYVLPARLGECTFKVGGFEGGFEDLGSVPFENEYGYSEDYRIYKSVNSGLGKTTVEVS